MPKQYMEKALALAKKGLGFTSSNPCVGAVIVKNGVIMGEGWHEKAGEDHAETFAIKSVKKKSDLKGADLYVTLEPCCHFGKTPPCVDAIVKSGIKKVYVGMKDPFKEVNGKGIKFLEKHGIKVEVLDEKEKLAKEIKKINLPFIKWAKTGLPYVTFKAAISLDGKIGLPGKRIMITSKKSRKHAKFQRSLCDCVMIGANTVRVDNPELGVSPEFKGKKLLRVIVSSGLNFTLKEKIFRDRNVFVACTKKALKEDRKRFEKAGFEYGIFGKNEVDFMSLFKFLAKDKNVRHVFSEGGGRLNGSLFKQNKKNGLLIDRFLFYTAPKIIGKRGVDVIKF